METVFLKIVSMGIAASYCVMFLCVARLLLRKCPKIFSYLLWSIVAIRLLCPVGIESRFSLMPDFEWLAHSVPESLVTAEVEAYVGGGKFLKESAFGNLKLWENMNAAHSVPESLVTAKVEAYTDGVKSPESQDAHSVSEASLKPQKADSPNVDYQLVAPTPAAISEALDKETPRLLTGMSYVWLLVTLLLFAYDVISYGHIKRKLKARAVYGYQYKKIPVYTVEGLESPFVMGIKNAVIYLPKSLTEQESRYCLSHEYIHIRRRDYLIKQLAFLLTCVYWFHPLIWLAFHLMAKDMEMSCDESALKNADLQERKAYSKTLLQLSSERRIFEGYSLAFGRNHISSRIRNIMNPKRKSLGITLIVITFMIVSAILLLTDRISQPSSLLHLFSHSAEGGKDVAKYVSDGIDSTTRVHITPNLIQCTENQELYAVAILADPDPNIENADSKSQIQVKAQPCDDSDNIIGILNPGDKVQILSIGSGITTKAELYGDLPDVSRNMVSIPLEYAMVQFRDLDSNSPKKGYVRIENLSIDVPENGMDSYIYWTAKIWCNYFCTKNFNLMSRLSSMNATEYGEYISNSEAFAYTDNPRVFPLKGYHIAIVSDADTSDTDISKEDEVKVKLYYYEESAKPEMTIWRQDLTIQTDKLQEVNRIEDLLFSGAVSFSAEKRCGDKISSYEEFRDIYMPDEGIYCFSAFNYEDEIFQLHASVRSDMTFKDPEFALRHYLHLDKDVLVEEVKSDKHATAGENKDYDAYTKVKCTFSDDVSLVFPMYQKMGIWYIDSNTL